MEHHYFCCLIWLTFVCQADEEISIHILGERRPVGVTFGGKGADISLKTGTASSVGGDRNGPGRKGDKHAVEEPTELEPTWQKPRRLKIQTKRNKRPGGGPKKTDRRPSRGHKTTSHRAKEHKQKRRNQVHHKESKHIGRSYLTKEEDTLNLSAQKENTKARINSISMAKSTDALATAVNSALIAIIEESSEGEQTYHQSSQQQGKVLVSNPASAGNHWTMYSA